MRYGAVSPPRAVTQSWCRVAAFVEAIFDPPTSLPMSASQSAYCSSLGYVITSVAGHTFIEPEDVSNALPLCRGGLDANYRCFTPDHRDILQSGRVGIGVKSPVVIPPHLGLWTDKTRKWAGVPIDSKPDGSFVRSSVGRWSTGGYGWARLGSYDGCR